MARIVVLIAVALVLMGSGDHPMVRVPRLIGMEEHPARMLLAEKGLLADVKRLRTRKPAGIVVGQGPTAGVEVMEKFEVIVYVSTGPQ